VGLRGKARAVIDPVLDYDPDSGEVDIRSIEAILKTARDAGIALDWALETHAHADHLSGAPYIKVQTEAKNERVKALVEGAGGPGV
jgi:glyoxylase-like metal-dependent hydrolase (beta-lactamase superfamily II)